MNVFQKRSSQEELFPTSTGQGFQLVREEPGQLERRLVKDCVDHLHGESFFQVLVLAPRWAM
jgi:hypothetical protein